MFLNYSACEDSESPLDSKEMKAINPKGNHPDFIGSIDAGAESATLWPPGTKSWLTEKDPDAGKDWGQAEKRIEDEMAGWHHQLMDISLSELQEMVKDREVTESDTTERLNNNHDKSYTC